MSGSQQGFAGVLMLMRYPGFLSVAVTNTMSKTTQGRKNSICLMPPGLGLSSGKSGQEFKQEHEAETMEKHCLLASSLAQSWLAS